MEKLQELENKIRKAIPELKEQYEAFEDGSIDRDMITPIMLNHVLQYAFKIEDKKFLLYVGTSGTIYGEEPKQFSEMVELSHWDLKSPYLKKQSEELINFLNEL